MLLDSITDTLQALGIGGGEEQGREFGIWRRVTLVADVVGYCMYERLQNRFPVEAWIAHWDGTWVGSIRN